MKNASIEVLTTPCEERDLQALAALLVDAVDAGAAVSFLQPLSLAQAEAWWRSALASLHPKGAVLVARDPDQGAGSGEIVATVQLQPAWAPNQPHRAEVCKMIVHRRAQRRGLGRQLMQAVERIAGERGFTLLTLDARAGGAAERLYRALGWTFVGTIPDYAVDADGQGLHDTVVFYRRVAPSDPPARG